jgi:nicotinamidase-related amidase
MSTIPLLPQSQPFLGFLEKWVDKLPVMPLSEAIPEARKTALLSVDLTNGFCNEGPLSSPRVGAIVNPNARLFLAAYEAGVRNFVVTHDAHEPDAFEFSAWPAHCVRGTPEAELVDELKALPFYDRLVVMEKNSISSSSNTGLNDWLACHPEVNNFIVTGDCTDLCTYQLTMHLMLFAEARQIKRRVVVPADCVDTYDRSVETAQVEGGLPHPGALMHAIFLYHMTLNGIEVVKSIG